MSFISGGWHLSIGPHFHRIFFFEPWVKLGANGIFEGPGLIERWSDRKENVMPDFVKNQLDFPEMVLELPGLLFLSVKEIFQMFQNVTRDPQVQNESWVSSYIQACCEGPADTDSDENDIAEELKKEISEPGLEKDFFTQLELQDAKIWIGRFIVKEKIVSRLPS